MNHEEHLDGSETRVGSGWVKTWQDDFAEEFGVHFSPSELKFALNFIEELLAEKNFDFPVGASQWLAHGEKYGYADYFRKLQNSGKAMYEQGQKDTLAGVKRKVEGMKIYDSDDTSRTVINMHGFNDALDEVLAILNQ